MTQRIAAVIPARYGSSRFPGKPLALLWGRPMIVHVCERVKASRFIHHLWVATDDDRIAAAVSKAGFEARMTPSDCASGSDRIITSLKPGEHWDILVNVQGDEPTIDPKVIDAVIEALLASPECGVSTAVVPIRGRADFESPHVVKAVVAPSGRALYFSRSPLPSPARLDPKDIESPYFTWGLKHLGLYAYRAEVLKEFATWAPTPLEQREKLEQLRLMEHGIAIQAAIVEHDSVGVDTPEELARLNGK
ncbi:3-deoxy-manno-octulosonate cytidylyltransferase [bacterium]|nr:3-deoxy-manno-octulosonate cytidylyltransferase [bacterium]